MASELGQPPAAGALRLEPLAEAHRAPLRTLCAEDLSIWAMYAVSFDPDHFDASFDMLLGNPARVPFAVVDEGAIVGMSAYIDADRQPGVVEIGNTYLRPAARGTGLNARLKRLMLGHAFACGHRRVEFRVDLRNARSQAAMAKIGAVREGVLRQERVTWTGHVRDTVLYSVLRAEWPTAG